MRIVVCAYKSSALSRHRRTSEAFPRERARAAASGVSFLFITAQARYVLDIILILHEEKLNNLRNE